MGSIRVAVTIALALGAAAVAPAQERWGGNRGYGYEQRGGGPASQIGFEDGRRDGERDAFTGHSFRPTHGGNYHHADRGYRREYGPRGFYKDQYRSAYVDGYRAGYGTRGWRR